MLHITPNITCSPKHTGAFPPTPKTPQGHAVIKLSAAGSPNLLGRTLAARPV